MWSWLRAGLKGINGAKHFKWPCFTKVSKCLLEEHMDFLSLGKEKIHIYLKTEYASVLVGKAHMNPSGTAAVFRLKTLLPKYYHGLYSKLILCQSLEQLWKLSHHLGEPGKCQLQVGLGSRSCQRNKPAQ